jgi:predicted 3-demethylubiquinone-9 3-methyltransferase (glyoxalase superfamily)
MLQKISPCLWFDTQAEQAANYYVSIFKNSKINAISHYPDSGQEIHGKPADSVLTVVFELEGQSFVALNGGPQFQFSPAVSLHIDCETQEEVDYYWEKLSAGGDPSAQQCGWVADKFGVSWQIVPNIVQELITSSDAAASKRVFEAIMEMQKLDIAELQRAFKG